MIQGKLCLFTESESEGKSGSYFLYSNDGKYLLKVIERYEHKSLRKILKSYYGHMLSNKESLLPRYYGMHKIKINSNNTLENGVLYFFITENVIGSPLKIDRQFDLKGSRVDRL